MIGYARSVSAPDSLERQTAALRRAGCSAVHTDYASSGRVLRRGLEAALADVGPGDALCVVSLDRLARSSRDLFAYAAGLSQRQAHLVSLAEEIDTRRDNGMFFGVCAMLDRLHHAGDVDRRAVSAAREARGPGPEPRLTDEVWSSLAPRIASGELSAAKAAKLAGVHRATVYRRLGAGSA